MQTIQSLEEALRSSEFGSRLLADTLCQQLLIRVNRDIRQDRTAEQTDSYRLDPKIEEILRYIGGHLADPLDVETLAKRFFLSRYYLMHRFKEITGYTVHQYITQKRLLQAGELIHAGTPVMKAAEQAGFAEYSTFLRAFQNTFHISPREFYGPSGKKGEFHASTDID
jgi:AraC-like DNA-binding protein